jgi:hypothetical protein
MTSPCCRPSPSDVCTCPGRDADGYLLRECPIHVACDDHCKALLYPLTGEEVKAAYTHWRSHHRLGGCSHGC